MNWKQVIIETTEQAADVVSSVLLDAGAIGTETEGGIGPEVSADEVDLIKPVSNTIFVKAYYGEQDFEKILAYIKGRIASLKPISELDTGSLDIAVNTVMDEDWNESFKKHFTTFRAAGNIIIKPTWEDYDAKTGEIVIEMDPGCAFGSGEHETTRMCLELIQKYMRKGASVLDVGCGSGILGIASLKHGASNVLSLDNDSQSVKVTRENAQQNDASPLTVRQSDLLQNADNETYDMVLANIIADIILRLNKNVSDYMNKNAVYIISGIIGDRLGEVLDSLKNNGLAVIEILEAGDWRAIAARRCDA